MGSNNYRGEISQIVDDVFINYTLELPDEELTSTSGYFMKGSPMRYSYFTVQRGATSQCEQTTEVYEIDRATGNKIDKKLAALTWSSHRSKDVCLGLITGYTLPQGWEKLMAPPYYSCYVSAASVKESGIGHNPKTGKIDLHTNRIRALDSAILTIYLPPLPAGISINDLQVFLNSHKEQEIIHDHSHNHALPQPIAVASTPHPSGTGIMVGVSGQPLPMGLYVVAMPSTGTVIKDPYTTSIAHHHGEAVATVEAV
jgi:hypothetical protein